MSIVKRNGVMPSASFFDDFFTKDLFDWPQLPTEGGAVPRVNVLETNNDFRVEMAAPGWKKEDFHVELNGDMLSISTEVADEAEKGEGVYKRREFRNQSFKRSFYLPNTVETEKIKAKYENGMLSMIIPKKEEAKKKPVKRISIS